MIDGVKIKKLNIIPDERGKVMEILRCDDEIFKEFGQVYMTTTYPGVVKAWHYHKIQTDNICCVKGMIKVVLYDDRKDSRSYKKLDEFFIGEYNQILISIPHGIYHGWKCISGVEAIVINIPNKPYNRKTPDEYRLPPTTNKIPYKWVLTPGKKHG